MKRQQTDRAQHDHLHGLRPCDKCRARIAQDARKCMFCGKRQIVADLQDRAA